MKMYKSKTWQHEITREESNAILFDVKIFEYEWHRTGKRAAVKDPLYNQNYKFEIYTVEINGETHEFAAGEFSNGVWGFYLFKF